MALAAAAAPQLQTVGLASHNAATLQHSVAAAPRRAAAVRAMPRRHTGFVVRAARRDPASRAGDVSVRIAAAAAATVLVPGSASAVEVETISNMLTQVEDISSQVTDKAFQSYDVVKEYFDQFISVAKPAVEASIPVIKSAAEKAYDVAVPVAGDLVQRAQQALTDAGVDTKPLLDAAKTASQVAEGVTARTGEVITAATPTAQSTVETVLAQEPTILAAGAGGLVVLYLLAPRLGSAIAYSARGFAGELTAAQTLDLVSTADYKLVDVRTEKEKVRSGVPSLPRSARGQLSTVPIEEVPSKLRGQLRNARKVEAEMVAIKISALKKLGKSSKIVLLDANGGMGKLVAKSLSTLGFKSTFIVKDGVDGGSGWLQSQLATEPYYSKQSEVLSPSRIIPAASRVFGTRSGSGEVVDVPPPRRGFLLGSGSDD